MYEEHRNIVFGYVPLIVFLNSLKRLVHFEIFSFSQRLSQSLASDLC